MIKFHWNKPKNPGRIEFSSEGYWYKDCYGDIQWVKRPATIHNTINRWYGVVLFNKIWIGVMKLGPSTTKGR